LNTQGINVIFVDSNFDFSIEKLVQAVTNFRVCYCQKNCRRYQS